MVRGRLSRALFASVFAGALLSPSIALAEDGSAEASGSAVAAMLAQKLKIEEQELEKQRHDIEALRLQLRALLAKATQAGRKNAQRSVQARQGQPTSPPASPAPMFVASPQQTNDEAAVTLRTEQLQSEFLNSVRAGQIQTADASALPAQPVGQEPEQPKRLPDAAALPEEANLLTPPGTFIFTPSVEYTRSSTNALIFHGIQIAGAIDFGIVNASNVSDDLATVAADMRVGLLDRLELEVKLPWVAHGDRASNLSPSSPENSTTTLTTNPSGYGLGDVEGSVRYQLNGDVQQDNPIYIVSLRIKSNSGVGPFDVNFDTSGDALTAPTGTGFWGVGPGFVILVPSDPGLLYLNGAYLHSFAHYVGKKIGSDIVGNVQPGDSIQLGLGFSLAVNSKFSFSLGYSHTAILPTTENLSGVPGRSETLQAGQFTLGGSYAVTPEFVVNTQFEFGVTSDAPNMDVTFRVPMSLGTL